MRVLGYLTAYLLFIESRNAEEFCSADRREDCKNDADSSIKYSKGRNDEYQKYFDAIRDANASYVECSRENCACYKDIISKDLKPFKEKGIDRKSIANARPRGTFYQIIGGKLYREKECMFPARCAGIEHFILSVIVGLPNMELVINTRDYPQSSKHFAVAAPIFSFSKSPEYFDIRYPAWGFWEGGPAISLYPRGLGRWDLHRTSIDKAGKKVPWDSKKAKAFFRGSRTSAERDSLVLLSRRRPNLVDARYTKNQAWKSDADTLHAPPAEETSLESHCDYKYLFNYRGVAASFRHKHLFLCRSLVFHVGDQWTEFYYNAMKPWVHYIPVPRDASEEILEELINFAKANDELARNIAERGRDFIWTRLRMRDVSCFWRALLKKYAKLLTYQPVLDESLQEIKPK